MLINYNDSTYREKQDEVDLHFSFLPTKVKNWLLKNDRYQYSYKVLINYYCVNIYFDSDNTRIEVNMIHK